MEREQELRDRMLVEALERMVILGISIEDRESFSETRAIPKVFVDHKERKVQRREATDEEVEMCRKWEEEKRFLVYYLIQDEGLWPDGCTFPRYTLLYVDEYVNDYNFVKEKSIKACGAVPAFIINMEEPDCSERAEIAFQNVDGLIINMS